MKVLVTGAGGQLAWELEQSTPADCDVTCCGRSELDITDAAAVQQTLRAQTPEVVINAAAYTGVDKAESEQTAAYAVNAEGVAHLAQACAETGAYLLHISTDFVFDGAANQPYSPETKPAPLGAYGASKLAGEAELVRQMASSWCIIRTGWVYSAHGSNFVKSMLRLMKEKPELGIVCDQLGTPTWAAGLASVCWAAARARLGGTYHWSDAGTASWYDFAVLIQRLALEKGLLQKEIPIKPIRTADYPTPARRPAYSVLDKSPLLTALPEVEQRHWVNQLSSMLDQL